MTLPARRARFVEEYLVDLNATQAAIRAGFSTSGAAVEGARLLRNAKVAAEIAKAMTARSERTEITQDRVLEELGRIGFSDMRSFASWGSHGVTLKEDAILDEDAARCVSEVSQSVSKDGGSIKFKLHDKVGALERIGKHLGMFVDRSEIQIHDLTPEQREDRVLRLLQTAKARKQG